MSQDQPKRPPTVLESVEDLRAQIRRGQTVPIDLPGSPAGGKTMVVPTTAAVPADDTAPFRPTHRPSMALLVVLDDGEEEGETLRIRDARFVIGRTEGNIRIPHDNAVSSKHAEIIRKTGDGNSRWYLRDLGSSNGTFVRITRSVLQPGQELLLGGRRYVFENTAPAGVEPPGAGGPIEATRKFQVLRPADETSKPWPTLVEIGEASSERRMPLVGPEHWIGRDPKQCSITIDDPMLSPRHARITRDSLGRWLIENVKAMNGTWFRVSEIGVDRSCHFLCGEQRFLLRIP